jgi:sarcosine oxidase/L-pipecolate oxidase
MAALSFELIDKLFSNSTHRIFSNMSPPSTRESYLIVGAGVFGASSAYHLAKSIPSASITLVDRSPFPCPLAASYDWQKVVRPDYGDLFYMELALKAQDKWRKEALYSRFYHESGIVKIEPGDLAQKMVENFKKLGVKSEAHIVDSEGLKKAYPLFRDTDYTSVKDCYVNATSGWAEATSALRGVTQAAVDLGVTYVEGTVSKLLFNSEGDCLGIETEDGRRLNASNIVLATGANTPKILADSVPDRPEMQVGDRILGAAVVTGAVKLTDAQMEHFGKIPIMIHRGGDISGGLQLL